MRKFSKHTPEQIVVKLDKDKELRELREQNARLKQLLGQAELAKAALCELAEGNF